MMQNLDSTTATAAETDAGADHDAAAATDCGLDAAAAASNDAAGADDYVHLPARRGGTHRAPPMVLSADPAEASAQALAIVSGADGYSRARVASALAERVELLVDADGPKALAELALHLPILHQMFLRFGIEAVNAADPAHKATLQRMALAAQRSYSQTLALIAGLKLQRKGKATVIINPDDPDS